jgi:hypothetical protein
LAGYIPDLPTPFDERRDRPGGIREALRTPDTSGIPAIVARKRLQSAIPAKSACATDGLTRQGKRQEKPGCAKICIALARLHAPTCPIVELADSTKAEVANVVAEIGEDDSIRKGRQGTRFRRDAAAT